jgi:hypothetical protein
VVIEAGVVAGYVIAWAVRKARRVAGRLDAEADVVIDAGLDRLHEVVAGRLGGHPVLAELAEEAEAAGEVGGVSDLTRQRAELELAAAARKDDAFGQVLTELVARLREAELAAGKPLVVTVRQRVDDVAGKVVGADAEISAGALEVDQEAGIVQEGGSVTGFSGRIGSSEP